MLSFTHLIPPCNLSGYLLLQLAQEAKATHSTLQNRVILCKAYIRMYMYLRHSLQAQGQFMHRLLHGAACRTLELWRAHADQKSTLRRRAQRVVARFTSRALATGFEAWIHSVSQTKRLKMMVAAMLQRKVRIIFAPGIFAFVPAKSLTICHVFPQKDCISSILQCWREYTSEVRISTMRIRKAVRRWTNGALCTSLDAWVQLTSDEKRRRYVVRRSVLRMKSRYQLRSWQRWTQAVAERKEVLSKIKILASKRKHPAMDLCFREWRNLMVRFGVRCMSHVHRQTSMHRVCVCERERERERESVYVCV